MAENDIGDQHKVDEQVANVALRGEAWWHDPNNSMQARYVFRRLFQSQRGMNDAHNRTGEGEGRMMRTITEIFTDRSIFSSEAECVQVAVKYAAQFNWAWAAINLLSDAAFVEYHKAIDAAGDKYDKAVAAAWDEYHKAIAAACVEYYEARAWAEFGKASDAAWNECDKAIAAARDERRKACAPAFARLWFNDREAA